MPYPACICGFDIAFRKLSWSYHRPDLTSLCKLCTTSTYVHHMMWRMHNTAHATYVHVIHSHTVHPITCTKSRFRVYPLSSQVYSFATSSRIWGVSSYSSNYCTLLGQGHRPTIDCITRIISKNDVNNQRGENMHFLKLNWQEWGRIVTE